MSLSQKLQNTSNWIVLLLCVGAVDVIVKALTIPNYQESVYHEPVLIVGLISSGIIHFISYVIED